MRRYYASRNSCCMKMISTRPLEMNSSLARLLKLPRVRNDDNGPCLALGGATFRVLINGSKIEQGPRKVDAEL